MSAIHRSCVLACLALLVATLARGEGAVAPAAPGADPPGTVHVEVWPTAASPLPPDPALEAAVEELLGRLTLEELVGQVIQASIQHVTPEEAAAWHLGSVLNGGGGWPGDVRSATPADWLALADAYWDASMDTSDGRPAIPILWGADAVHGHSNVVGATLFPHNIALGATRDPDLVRRIGEVTAAEMEATGIDWNFSPTVAVARDDRWGRTYESYSEDPAVVHSLARAMVEGLQGAPGTPGFLGDGRVLATSKHFLGDGGTAGGRDQGDNRASEKELVEVHLAGYRGALEAGVQAVMASFSSWHGVKMHGHRPLLTDVLKGRLGFDGIVVGDWNGHGQVPDCTNASCPQAFNAGVDLVMVPEDWKALYAATLAQVKGGEIPRERLEEAVRRILRVKMRAGLFTAGRPSARPGGDPKRVGSPAHREVARQAVRQSLVLLKNDGGLLPLRPGQHVLVAGDGADDIGKQCGGWTISWQGTENTNADFPGASSIWEGIRAAVEAGGGTATLAPDGRFEAHPDVALVVYGEDPYAEFEGDRDTVLYDGAEDLAMLRRLREAGVPTVSVFLSGRPQWVNPHLNASTAFVAVWLPGTEGAGVADVLFASPDGSPRHDVRGRLPFSWPKRPDQGVLNAGDLGYDPLFPLGHGLAYADAGDLPVLSENTGGLEASRGNLFFDGGDAGPWHWSAAEGVTNTPLYDERRPGARALRFAGGGDGAVRLEGDDPLDLTRESNGNLALALDLAVLAAPSGPVRLAMGCGEDCTGAVDLTGLLAGLPPDEWRTVRVRLRCFAEKGADMARIDAPLHLSTRGSFALGLASVQLLPATEGAADCP